MSYYDPEIDPTIREEEESLLREQEEQQQKEERLAELRSVFNDLMDEREARKELERVASEANEEQAVESSEVQEPTEESAPERPFAEEEPTQEPPKRRQRSGAGKAIVDIISGGILSDPKVRGYYPYLIGFGILIVLYLMSWFGVQRLQHTQQVLEKQLRTIRTEAVTISSEAKQQTNRSNITKRIAELGLDLEESTKPVKVIEK